MRYNPTTSVLLPTYNGAPFLAHQLRSILDQSSEDFELIAMDDGSSDGSASILQDFAERDRRVRHIPSTGNQGQRVRLRQLLSHASGEFIAIADQDDVWSSNRNERLIGSIGDRAIAFGRSQLVDTQARDLGRSLLEKDGIDAANAGCLQTLFVPLVSAHAAIMRRDWLDPATLYGPSPFDWMLGIEAMLSSGLVYDDSAVVHHRIHGANQTNREAAAALQGQFSLRRLHGVLMQKRPDRLSFFLAADQLSRSIVIKPEARLAMHHAAAACRYAWFHPLDLKPRKRARLKAALSAILSPFASSPHDLAVFNDQVGLMLHGAMTVRNVASGITGALMSASPAGRPATMAR